MGRTGQTPGNGPTGLDSAPSAAAGVSVPTSVAVALGGSGATSLGGSATNLAPYQTLEASLFDLARQRLNALSPNLLHSRFWDMDFGTSGLGLAGGNLSGWTWNGGSNTQSAAFPGGVVTTDTTATASSLLAAYSPGFSLWRPDVSYGYMACRFRLPSAMDGQTFLCWALCKGINDHSIYVGFNGVKSTSNLVFVYDASGYPNSGTGTAVVLAPVDANWHTYEIWYGSGLVFVSIDGVQINGGFLMAAPPSVPVWPALTGYNGSTAASRKLDTDWVFVATLR